MVMHSKGKPLEIRLHRLFTSPNRKDILHFLKSEDPVEVQAMFDYADRVRHGFVGDVVHLRAIIEFSNYCRNSCLYCGINAANRKIQRYRMSLDQIVDAARRAARLGFLTLVLQSGEDPHYLTEDYVALIRRIKEDTGMAITLAIGEKKASEYRAYFKAGADRFLLKHETSDRVLYERLNPGLSYRTRIQCLKTLKTIGFQTGSGIMIGLPGQTLESIANDIILFRRLDIDMIGCGPFIPHPETRLADAPPGTAELTLRIVALTRIVTRDTHIPSTTALSVLEPREARARALMCGANVVMPNLTPQPYRSYYEIYPNKGRIEVQNEAFVSELREQIVALGRTVATDPGHRIRRQDSSTG